MCTPSTGYKMNVCKAGILAKAWIFLTFILFVALLTIFNVPRGTTTTIHTILLKKGSTSLSEEKTNNYQKYRRPNRVLTVKANIVEFSGYRIKKSNTTKDESTRPSAGKRISQLQSQEQKGTLFDLQIESVSGKVAQDAQEVGNEEQTHPNNPHTSRLGNEKHTYKHGQYEHLYRNYRNFLVTDPPEYLPNFKNPCWNESSDDGQDFRIQCLPYFYLAGFPKCGTTDLFFEMSKHHGFIKSKRKEPHWWTRNRFGRTNFDAYLKLFKNATEEILSNRDEYGFHWMITGEGSASTFWDMKYINYPENQNNTEPKVVLADEIYHMTPQAKFIIILRNPTARLYSDYLYFHDDGQPDVFHELVLEDLSYMETCLHNHPEGGCAFYNRTRLKTRLQLGMYTVFLEEWLKVLPREQIHVLRLEDYTEDKEQALNDIFQFLALGPVQSDTNLFDSDKRRNARTREDKKKGPMLEKTKQLLDNFYRPFNTRLAHLLNNERYLWLSSS